MYIYFILLILILISSILNPKKFNVVDVFIFISFSLISGFRYNVGTDYSAYVDYFERVKNTGDSGAEIGFDFIALIISELGFNYQFMFIVLSSLTMLFGFKGAKYFFENGNMFKPVFYIIFIIFVFIPSFNAVRQILAASIIFYSMRFLIQRSFVKYSIWVFIASLFHFSSLVMIPIYFVAYRKFHRITLVSILLFTIFLSFMGIFSKVMDLIATQYTILDFGGYVSNYIDSSYNQNNIDLGIVFLINFALLLFLLFMNKRSFNSVFQLHFNLYFLYIIFLIIAIDVFVFARFQYYLSIYMACAIASIPVLFDQKSRSVVKTVMLTLYILLFTYVIVNGYINYQSNDNFPLQFNFDLLN